MKTTINGYLIKEIADGVNYYLYCQRGTIGWPLVIAYAYKPSENLPRNWALL